MKIPADELKPGMIIYSVPTDFDNPDPERHKKVVLDAGGKLKILPVFLSSSKAESPYPLGYAANPQSVHHLTWLSALLTAKARIQGNIDSATEAYDKLQTLIDSVRGIHG